MAPRPVRLLQATLVLLTAGQSVAALAGVSSVAPDWLVTTVAAVTYVGVIVLVMLRVGLVRAQRLPWLAIGASICVYAAGTAYAQFYTRDGAELPFPSLADALWLSFYPLALCGTLLLLVEQQPGRRTLLDGVIAGLGGAAVFSAGVIDLLLGLPPVDGFDDVVASAFPLGDALLVATLAAQLALGRWAGAQSALIMGGFAFFIVADCTYLVLGTDGMFDATVIDTLYRAGLVTVGLAGWRRSSADGVTGGRNPARVSIWFAVGALVVLLAASRERMSTTTVTLAGLTIVAVVARVLTTIRELEAVGQARYAEARRDPLTGLANRRAMHEHLDSLLANPRPGVVALLLMDLDRFKQVNDTYGHHSGDDLLAQVAARLRRSVRAADLVGRLGGDEFVVVAAHENVDPRAVLDLAERIREQLRGTYTVAAAGDPVEVAIDVSIGVALHAAPEVDRLLREADIAMYQAKRAGGGHCLYERATSDIR